MKPNPSQVGGKSNGRPRKSQLGKCALCGAAEVKSVALITLERRNTDDVDRVKLFYRFDVCSGCVKPPLGDNSRLVSKVISVAAIAFNPRPRIDITPKKGGAR